MLLGWCPVALLERVAPPVGRGGRRRRRLGARGAVYGCCRRRRRRDGARVKPCPHGVAAEAVDEDDAG